VVNYRSDAASATQLVDGIRAAGGEAHSIQADVADEDQVRTMFGRIRELDGGVDVVFNNAGILTSGLLTMTRPADFDALVAVNVRGVFLVMQQAAKQMARKKAGRIINCSSIFGRRGARGHVAYSGAKAAVIGMSLAAAKELGPLGITVNVVAPGFVTTDMTREVDEVTRQEFVAAIPLARPADPDEVARVVVFLAGDEAAYINGQVIGVDGGQVV
jgi:3-oxoacyl-[acyl-carrier protein] reductase